MFLGQSVGWAWSHDAGVPILCLLCQCSFVLDFVVCRRIVSFVVFFVHRSVEFLTMCSVAKERCQQVAVVTVCGNSGCTGLQQERHRWCSVVLYDIGAKIGTSLVSSFSALYVQFGLPLVVSIKRSTSPLACGHNGVMRRCVNPRSLPMFLKSSPWNGGPLSICTVYGMPCLEKMLSRFGITVLAEVDLMISTSGKRL